MQYNSKNKPVRNTKKITVISSTIVYITNHKVSLKKDKINWAVPPSSMLLTMLTVIAV